MCALCKVGAPLFHGFIQWSNLSSHRPFGVASFAGLSEIEPSFVFTAFLSGIHYRKKAGRKDHGQRKQYDFMKSQHENLSRLTFTISKLTK